MMVFSGIDNSLSPNVAFILSLTRMYICTSIAVIPHRGGDETARWESRIGGGLQPLYLLTWGHFGITLALVYLTRAMALMAEGRRC